MSGLLKKIQDLDEKISYRIYRSVPKNKKYRSILKFLEYSCNGVFWLVFVLILIYLSPEYKPYTYLFGGLILDIVYVALVKAYARRRRPHYAIQTDQLMMVSVDKHSFPSGHATRAVYIALFVNLYFKNLFLTTLTSIYAVSLAASRVLLARHYLADVLCGVVIAYIEYFLQFGVFKFINPLFYSVVSSVFLDINKNDFDALNDALED